MSVFIDESGVFGPYEPHSPFYIVTLVFHDQSVNIADDINIVNSKINYTGVQPRSIHAGPLIRRESEYRYLSLMERKRIFNILYNFTRKVDIKYQSLVIEKRQLVEDIDLIIRITKQLSAVLFSNMKLFSQFDRVIVYYDFGQMELTKILVSVFNTVLSNVEFKKVTPMDYKLFQAADMLCTLELLALKAQRKMLSKSELTFFTSERDLNKSYLKAIQRKRFG